MNTTRGVFIMSERIRLTWSFSKDDCFSISKPEDWDVWQEWEKDEYLGQKVQDEISEQIECGEIGDQDLRWSHTIEKAKDV